MVFTSLSCWTKTNIVALFNLVAIELEKLNWNSYFVHSLNNERCLNFNIHKTM